MKNKIFKGLKIGGSILTGLFMVLILYLLICNVIAVKKEKPVNYFGYTYSYVPTQSMEPTIHQGDTIIFKKIKYSNVNVNDIIVFKSNSGPTAGKYVVHRVIAIETEGFITKGDNNDHVDTEVVTKNMLLGKYQKTFNFMNIGKLAQNKNVIYAILVLFFLGIAILEAVNILLVKRKKELEKVGAVKSQDELRQEIMDEMKAELLKEILDNEKEE